MVVIFPFSPRAVPSPSSVEFKASSSTSGRAQYGQPPPTRVAELSVIDVGSAQLSSQVADPTSSAPSPTTVNVVPMTMTSLPWKSPTPLTECWPWESPHPPQFFSQNAFPPLLASTLRSKPSALSTLHFPSGAAKKLTRTEPPPQASRCLKPSTMLHEAVLNPAVSDPASAAAVKKPEVSTAQPTVERSHSEMAAEYRKQPPPSKSYREAVSASWSKNVDVSFPIFQTKELSSFEGEPAFIISEEEEMRLAKRFRFALIGMFPRGRPAMELIRKEIIQSGFSGECYTGLIDHKHIIFQFQLESDFHRMWMKKVWNFGNFQAKIFRWSTDFCPGKEPSIVPVWIRFPLLPVHFCDKESLFTLGSAVGNPLKLDLATAAMERVLRPSEARMCIEVDVLKPLPHRIWVGTKVKGNWQQILYEDLPEYCVSCSKLGHSHSKCKLPQSIFRRDQAKVWVPKKQLFDKGKSQVTSNLGTNMDQPNSGPLGTNFGSQPGKLSVGPLSGVGSEAQSEIFPQSEGKFGSSAEEHGTDQGTNLNFVGKNIDQFLANLGQLLQLINDKGKESEGLDLHIENYVFEADHNTLDLEVNISLDKEATESSEWEGKESMGSQKDNYNSVNEFTNVEGPRTIGSNIVDGYTTEIGLDASEIVSKLGDTSQQQVPNEMGQVLNDDVMVVRKEEAKSATCPPQVSEIKEKFSSSSDVKLLENSSLQESGISCSKEDMSKNQRQAQEKVLNPTEQGVILEPSNPSQQKLSLGPEDQIMVTRPEPQSREQNYGFETANNCVILPNLVPPTFVNCVLEEVLDCETAEREVSNFVVPKLIGDDKPKCNAVAESVGKVMTWDNVSGFKMVASEQTMDFDKDSGVSGFISDRPKGLNILNEAWSNLVGLSHITTEFQTYENCWEEESDSVQSAGVSPSGIANSFSRANMEDEKKRKYGMSDRVLRSMLRASNSDPSRAGSL